jgi:uncharacterized protein (DUF2236 family)
VLAREAHEALVVLEHHGAGAGPRGGDVAGEREGAAAEVQDAQCGPGGGGEVDEVADAPHVGEREARGVGQVDVGGVLAVEAQEHAAGVSAVGAELDEGEVGAHAQRQPRARRPPPRPALAPSRLPAHAGYRMAAMARGAHDGLFGPDTVTWRVNREAVLLAGGGRALLLQVAHPSVAAGVREHSSFDVDPWRRLLRTLDAVTTITFGARERAQRAARGLRGAHRGVRGVRADGVAYDALDPDLLLWVWATLVDSALLVFQRVVAPLAPADLERYYVEQQRFAVACGVPEGHWPPTLADFRAYWEATVDGVLDVGDDARAIAAAVLDPALPGALAPLRPVALPALAALRLTTVGLLPPPVRDGYGFAWGSARQRVLDGSIAALRTVLPALPALAREFPAARAAERRRQVRG